MKNPTLIKIAENGRVLSSRERGLEAARIFEDAAAKGSFIVSFDGVEIATPSFLDELARRLSAQLHINRDLVVVIAGLNDEVRHSFNLVAQDQGLRFAELRDDQIDLLGGTEKLRETLAKAQELGTFKAADLAKELELKLPNVHQRLAALLDAGAIRREPDPSATRGRRDTYHAPDAKELGKVALAA